MSLAGPIRWIIALVAVVLIGGCALQSGQQTSPTPPTTAATETLPTAVQPVAAQTEPTVDPGSALLQPTLPSGTTQLDAEEEVVADIYTRLSPAVVRIETGQGLGSGFLIDANGHIVTNNHVVEDSRGQVFVSFTGLFQTVGRVVGTDPDSDIAVVKVEELPPGVVPVELGDSSQVRVGQRTIAIGNPLGQDRTVTTGIVSAVGRTISESDPQQGARYSIGGAIQTDAAINPGNSGGPLLDWRGRVIGMNTAILSRTGTSSGIGFAVPVNLIRKVSAALIRQRRYDHPYLGVGLRDITTLAARQNNLPSAGILIQPNDAGSPVARAGLRDAAILTAINNTPMTSSDELISYLELNTNPGDTVVLSLIDTNGRRQDLSVTLGARPTVGR